MNEARTTRDSAHTDSAPWRMRARLAEVARRHALPAGAAFILGSMLRLLWLGDTSFLGDQAQLLALGRSAVDHGALILTGIPSSIGTLNAPISTWLYGLFAITGGPLAATIFTALANIAAIALLYAIAARYLSRRAAFAAALLYATASGPTRYARFIWQQNLLAPVVLLFFGVMLLAVIERRQGWVGWALFLWIIATELHPTAAPLLGLIALALALTWRDVRLRDIAWSLIAVIVLVGPTLFWEILSPGADLAGLRHFSSAPSVIDTWALTYLFELITPAPAHWFGANSSYLRIGLALRPLDVLMLALLLAAQAWLLGIIAAPWLRRTREQRHTGNAYSALAVALADSRWWIALCLALWEALPLLFMFRHNHSVEPHYLLALLPGVYLAIGAVLAWASRWLQESLSSRLLTLPQGRALAASVLAILVIAVSAAQAVGVAGELATIHSGAFDGLALPLHYGTPLSSEARALAATQASARRLNANIAIASTFVQQEPLGYLNATTGAAATDYVSDGCVALPAASAQAPLLTLTLPGTSAALLLPQVQGASAAGPITVQGGSPYLLYDLAPGATINGERTISRPAATMQSDAPQPVAFTYTAAGTAGEELTIRWVGAPALPRDAASAVSYWYGADSRGAPIANYTFTLQALDAQGQAIGAPLTSQCVRLGWSPQLSVVTMTPLPASLATGGQVMAWRVSAQIAVARAVRPTLGSLAFESGLITFGPARPLGSAVTFAVQTP